MKDRSVKAKRVVAGLFVLAVVPALVQVSRPAEAASRGGTITGVVRFAGDYPPAEEITVTQNPDVCGTSKLSRMFVVSPETKGLKNVVVTVEGVVGGKASSPTATATVAQKGCTYEPHVQVVEVAAGGTEFIIHNEDGILHNIQASMPSMGGRALFNSAQPGALKELKKKLKRPGLVRLKCDVHGWMNAYVMVLKDQPYHSLTDDAGQFTLEDVPAGSYTIHAWHEALGEMTKTVTVTDGETTNVDWVIAPKGS